MITSQIKNLTQAIVDGMHEDSEKALHGTPTFVDECRRANPFTKKHFNITKQVRLDMMAHAVAVELKEAAKWEGTDDKKANPGLADAEKGV